MIRRFHDSPDFSPDIWEFPGQYIVCRIGFIGRDCVTTFVFTWHHVLFVWHISLQRHPDSPIVLVHCQDLKKVPRPGGMMSWIEAPRPEGAPTVPVWAPVQWPALHRDPPL